MYSLRLFGGISLEDISGAALVGIVYQRSLAVLALLAVARDKGCSREKLIGYLWAESDHERARHRLSDTVYMLRKSLGSEAVASAAGDILRLNPDLVESDAAVFLDALDGGDLETAALTYEGHFLDGFYTSGAPEFERWVESERRRFAEAYAGALERLAEQAQAASDYRRAVDWWKRLAAHDLYNSRYVLRLMDVLARSGDPANAIQVAQEHERLLKEDLVVEPVPEVFEFAERLRREAGDFADAVERPPPRMRPASAVSIAVLPFVNLGGDPAREYFSDGITGEIINHLGKVADLKVISRTSTMRYKGTDKNLRQIAEELDVATVVEGEVLQVVDRVRINAQLIDARTDTHLWADRYERQVAGIIELQSDIAKRIVTALQATLTPGARERIERRPTEDLEAYDLYLLGRHRWFRRGPENLRDAIRYFEAAIERDSTFALAWTGLADAWTALPWYERVPCRVAYAWGRDAARRALDLDEDLAEAHAALGGLALYYEWDWDCAETHLLRAVELNPNHAQAHHWLGLVHLYLGRPDQAVQSLQTALSLNPLAANFPGALAAILYDAGRVAEAFAAWKQAEKFDPPIPTDLWTKSLAFLEQGLNEEGFRAIERWGEVLGYRHPERLPVVLRAVEAPGLTEEALGVLDDVRRTTSVPAAQLAGLYLSLDAPTEALSIVQEAIADRHPLVPLLRFRPTRERVLRNPEIMAALQEAGVLPRAHPERSTRPR